MTDRRWHILAVLFLARTAMGFQFQSAASAGPFLIAELPVGYAWVGTLIGLYMLPGVVIAFPGGLLNRRFGDKSVCSAGLVLMIAGGVLMGFAHAPAPLLAGRLLAGTGAVLFNLVLTKMTTDWFAGREIVLAMGVVLASWPFGIAAGLLLQPPLARAAGWRMTMLVTAGLATLALLLIARLYRAPPKVVPGVAPAADGGRLPALPPAAQMLPTSVAGVMWGNLNLALVLFFSFAPGAMAAGGLGVGHEAAWIGAALWVVMLSVPLGGWAVQRSGRPDAAIVLFAALGAVALGLLPLGAAAPALAMAFGVAIGPPAGAVMALPARVLAPEHRPGGLGLFMTCYYVILSAGPAAAGLARAATGSAAAPLWVAATVLGSLLPLLGLFHLLRRPLTRAAGLARRPGER